MTLQLENTLAPKKVGTKDSKIFLFYQFLNSKKKIAESFKIEGLLKFEQYTTINPVNVEIIKPYLRLFYSSNYKCKYRFIANSLLFSSAITRETNAIFITTNEL